MGSLYRGLMGDRRERMGVRIKASYWEEGFSRKVFH